MNIKEIIPYENNPRNNDHAVDYVMNSIKEFGFKVPIIIDKNNIIVAGHTRLKAAEKMGMTEVPVIIADDLTDKQIKAFRLADNKAAEIAEWDQDLLMQELLDLETESFDMLPFGFDPIHESESADPVQVVDDDYEVELPEEAKSQLGDVYQLGDHRLMCGDSTSFKDVEKLMVNQYANLYVTDPPYNVDYEGSAGKIMNDSMSDSNFKSFLIDAFSNANEVMKEGAAFYIWHADSEGFNFRGACVEIGWNVRQCLIWNKNSLVMGRQDYQWKHEPCLYGWKDGAAHNWYSDRKQTTVLEFNKPLKNELHPTMKPIELIAYLVQNSSHTEDNVLDLFGGSGSTMIACEQLNRRCFMMELDPKYVDVIIDRWEQFTGQKAVKL